MIFISSVWPEESLMIVKSALSSFRKLLTQQNYLISAYTGEMLDPKIV